MLLLGDSVATTLGAGLDRVAAGDPELTVTNEGTLGCGMLRRGEINMGLQLYEQAGDVQQYLKAGQLRPLVIFATERHPAFPDVPASKELGLEIYLPQFRGVVARKGTPPDRIGKLADAFRQAMDTPQWKKFAEEWYMRPDSYLGPDRFRAWVDGEAQALDRFVKDFGLKK